MPPETSKLIWDMLSASRRIISFSKGKSRQDYFSDEMLRSAIERQFEILGEAMTRLIKQDQAVASQITDYRKITGFRNALIHGYDSINDEISWNVIEEKLPVLNQELELMLKT